MDVTVVSKEMALLSNLLAAYTFIAGGSNMKNDVNGTREGIENKYVELFLN